MLMMKIVGRRSYGLRRAPALSIRAREILADGGRLTHRRPRSVNTAPTTVSEGDSDEVAEVQTGNIQAESSQNGAIEVGGPDSTIQEPNRLEDEPASLASELAGDMQVENAQDSESEVETASTLGEDTDTEADTASLTSEVSDHEDARNLEPRTGAEFEALGQALEQTILQYVGITRGLCELADMSQNYFSQWAFYQQLMNTFWDDLELLSTPPKLVSLDRWTGGIENWESAQVLDSGLG